MGRISDRLCLEYGLSIVNKPQKKSKHYGKWLEENGGVPLSHSDNLRKNITEAIAEKPVDFEEFLQEMHKRGYRIKRGKHLAFRNEDMGKFIRLRSLGEDFSEENLRKMVSGEKKAPQINMPKFKNKPKDFTQPVDESVNLLIDIDKALIEKGAGYQRWAKKFNLKQMAKTVNYLSENNLMNYETLKEKADMISGGYSGITTEIKAVEHKLSEIKEVQENIIHYAKTKDIYKAYHKSGYSKKFKEQHEGDILLHETARDFFKKEGYTTFPKMSELKIEYATLLAEKNKLYGEYHKLKDDNKDILNAKANIEVLLDIKKDTEKNKKEREIRN